MDRSAVPDVLGSVDDGITCPRLIPSRAAVGSNGTTLGSMLQQQGFQPMGMKVAAITTLSCTIAKHLADGFVSTGMRRLTKCKTAIDFGEYCTCLLRGL
jgi:hypothetical protein